MSHNSAARDGETNSQHDACEAKNTDLARHHQEEADATTAAANAGRGEQVGLGGNPSIARNLQHEFFMVGNQEVEQTPSTNLAVATHKLDRLP